MARRNRRLTATLLAAVTVGFVLAAQPTAPTVALAAASSAPPHVMVIVEENEQNSAVVDSPSAPYLTGLAHTYASATNWFAIQHDSPADYVALISGSTQNWDPTATSHVFPGPTLVDELTAKGVGWKAYMEDAPSPCYTAGGSTVGGYYADHNPFVHFSSITSSSSKCNSVVPFASNFASDLNGGTAPPFMFVVPNGCNDMHDACPAGSDPVTQGDTWLHTNLPTVLNSSWYQTGGTVIITWDEGKGTAGFNGGNGGQIPTLVLSSAAHGNYTAGGDHYGTLRAIEEAYGVDFLGASADAANGDLTGAGIVPTIGHRFAQLVYSDLLGRSPDAAGLAYWSGLIDAGNPRYPISVSLTASTEYTGDAVQALYDRYLHRSADGSTSTGGEGFWVSQIAHGATYEQLAEGLIASDEYFNNRAGHDNTLYVTTLYQDLLGRAPEPDGLIYWVGRLNAGGFRGPVSTSILTSTEGYQNLVTSIFRTFLRHPPDGGGLAYWTGRLQSGLRDEQFIASIIGSDEYLQYAISHVS
jgi:hypothetical protein